MKKNKIAPYIQYLKTLSYPDYSNRARSQNGNLNMELLDLSLSQTDIINSRIIQALINSFSYVGEYHFTQNHELRKFVARSHGVKIANVLITSGCDGAIRVVSRALFNRFLRVGIPTPSFGRYEYHAKVNEAKINYIVNDRFPYDIGIGDLFSRPEVRSSDVVMLANPNNPTGILEELSDVRRFLSCYSGYTLLDESLLLPSQRSASAFITDYPNLIVVGSFSKVYGIAGARVGYIICNEDLAKSFEKLISPFEVSSLSLLLASVAINDKLYVKSIERKVHKSLAILQRCKSEKLLLTPSVTSTILIQYNENRSLYRLLLQNKIKTVPGYEFRGLDKTNTVRVSLRGIKEVKELVEVLKTI